MKQPIIDGKCLKVSAGETIVATRGIAGWVYGFRESDPRNKGWFPLEISNMKKKNDTKPDETSTSEDETSQDTATTEEEEKKNQ